MENSDLQIILERTILLPGGGQQILVNQKVHNQRFSVSHPKPHQDSSLQKVPLFDILSFR